MDKLAKCIQKCKGNAACQKACEDEFAAGGGVIQALPEGGKVFSDTSGGKVFITDGGKVF